MDHMHDYIKERLGLLDPVEVTTFEENYKRLLTNVGLITEDENDSEGVTVTEKIYRMLNIPVGQYSLEKNCRIDQLNCENGTIEILSSPDESKTPPSVDLSTVKYQIDDLKRREDLLYRRMCRKSWLSGVSKVVLNEEGKDDTMDVEEIVEVFSESYLTVQVYRPSKLERMELKFFPEIDREFVVLGSNKLILLRDFILCPTDFVVEGEFSECPDMSQETRALDIFPSGFFFINKTFYNDMRKEDARDYSEIIRRWTSEKDRGLGPYDTRLMESTRFRDLTLELGYPYLYMHQGSCEHLIVFTDLRLLGPDDSCISKHYPKMDRIFPKKRRPCMICKTCTSTWVTFDNSRASDDPFFTCTNCFRTFNYTQDDKKIGDFKAYPYIDHTSLN